MAKLCKICSKKIGFPHGGAVQLVDGEICWGCYNKTGRTGSTPDLDDAKRRLSIENALRLIEGLEPCEKLAEEKIKSYWKANVERYGWSEKNSTQLYDKEWWIYNGILYITMPLIKYYYNHSWEEVYACNSMKKYEDLQPRSVEIESINIEDIQYFYKEGDVQYTTSVYGGGSGGISVSGAIVGGLIAGGAGAVIGSRKKADPVRTAVKKHDERKTIFRFYREGTLYERTYKGYEMYDWLFKNIPEKDLMTINFKNQEKQNNSSNEDISTESKDYKEKLRILKELYEDGLIEKSEYEEKRMQILDQI